MVVSSSNYLSPTSRRRCRRRRPLAALAAAALHRRRGPPLAADALHRLLDADVQFDGGRDQRCKKKDTDKRSRKKRVVCVWGNLLGLIEDRKEKEITINKANS